MTDLSDNRSRQPREQVQLAHRQYYAVPAELVVTAPGRVNLIGEHTDYNDGFVLPLAINFNAAVAASRRSDRRIRAVALDLGSQVEIDLDAEPRFDQSAPWSNYLRGVLSELHIGGYPLQGADLTISGDVPQGAGLSSSAALEMALVRALLAISGAPIEATAAALIGQAAENNFVGCNCGIMDQLISAQGRRGHALLIDCRDLTLRSVPLPKQAALLIVNSNISRKLVDGEYNTRRQQCEAVASHMGVPALRDVDMAALLAVEHELGELEFRRARHVVSENARTEDTAQALIAGDLIRVGEYMAQSHASMRDDFDITVAEIDTLVAIIKSVIGDSGGTRMTGGGFGGCVVSLFPAELLPAVVAAVKEQYPRLTGLEPTLFECEAVNGAFVDSL